MDEQKLSVYSRCINCGRYIPKDTRIGDRFCSPGCAERYRRCPGCGSYNPVSGDADQPQCPHCGHRQEYIKDEGDTQ